MSTAHISRRQRFYLLSFFRHDFKASVTVFFVALPLCLGIAMASGTSAYAGLIAGIIGGLVVGFLSKSELSVSGPAAGLTAICTAAIGAMGSVELLFISVAIAGVLQLLLGLFRLGGFTHFIPSAVIKGMLSAIGILLISKQVPLLLGYDKPDFWTDQLFNLFTFDHGFSSIRSFYDALSPSALFIAALAAVVMWLWEQKAGKRLGFLPATIVVVLAGSLAAAALPLCCPAWQLSASQYVVLPAKMWQQISWPQWHEITDNTLVWRYAVVICFVASLETLLSIEAIDKLDPYNRLTPQNRELMAQGTGNILSGLLGGLPITAVIVRSAANAEAGARTRMSAITHAIWLLLAVAVAVPLINRIPYCVLAVILTRTGYNLVKPAMVKAVFRQGREQFMPFLFTVGAILLTDLLIGVVIGIVYSLYFIVKHTYRAGFTLVHQHHAGTDQYHIQLAQNVSFMNKRRLKETLDEIPMYSVVHISGTDCVYIDHDILEIIHDFGKKAVKKHIGLTLENVPAVESISLH
ncbi:MAG: SulP family inorganic anion transporter [Chitinophagaceae bacterium]|nr:SulP family inorganic anion transporter [Chitinophagaceae bacterium]